MTSVFVCLRVLYFFRGFSQSATLARMIVQVFRDIAAFFALCMVFWLGFTIALYHLMPLDPEIIGLGYPDLGEALVLTYRLMFLGESEWPMSENRRTLSFLGVFYLLTTFGTCVVMLNLLIALMSDTYVRVQENSVVTRNRELAKLIYDVETFIPQAMLHQRRYLVCAYHTSGEGTEAAEGMLQDSWEGASGEVKKILAQHQEDLRQRFRESDMRQKHVEERIDWTTTRLQQLEKTTLNLLHGQDRVERQLTRVLDHLQQIKSVPELIEANPSNLERRRTLGISQRVKQKADNT
jgi:hypothetical protein